MRKTPKTRAPSAPSLDDNGAGGGHPRWSDASGIVMLGKFLGTVDMKSPEQQAANRERDRLIREGREGASTPEAPKG